MKLSILICSLINRSHLLKELTEVLNTQVLLCDARNEVEILYNIDNKESSTGAKRQELLERAKGNYVIFIDDDDEIYSCYLEELLKACDSGCDCFAINGHYSINGGDRVRWELSMANQNEDIGGILLRKTNHITGVKRELALLAGFPDISNAEDKAYSEALNPHLKSEFKINPPMYHYRYSSSNKEYV